MFVRLWVSRAGWLLRYNGPILQCFRWCIRPWGVCASRRRASPSAWQLVWWKGGRELCFKLARSIFFWLYTQFTRIIIAPLGCYHLTNNVRACCFFFLAGASSLLNRYRPNAMQLASTCGPNGLISLNPHRRTMSLGRGGLSVKDDYGDPTAGGTQDPATAAAVAALELYHRWTITFLHLRRFELFTSTTASIKHTQVNFTTSKTTPKEREELYYSSEKEEGVM